MQLGTSYQKWFICLAICLTMIGILFVYSSSYYWGIVHYANEFPFYMKQLIYAIAALILFFIFIRLKIKWSKRIVVSFYIFSLLLLVMVLIPGIGIQRNGATSWIGVGSLTIQPAELAKISTLLLLCQMLAERKSTERMVQIKHFITILIPSALIMLQPDFGAVFLLVVASFVLFFIAGYPLKIFTYMVAIGVLSITALILSAPYRLKRISAFLNPWEDPLNSGFQAVQSLMAIGPGGLFGHGFLKSRQKYLYLPEPQNDFIFAIILEEIGFIGGTVIVIIFACFLYYGFRLAVNVKQSFHFYSIAALTILIGIQTMLNICVVIGLLPVTGVTLPFISYGGTSLMINWLTVGLMIQFSNG